MLDGAGKALLVLLLMVVGLHRLDLAQGLGHITADIGDPVLALARQAAHPTAKKQNRDQYQRQSDHHDTGELGVGDKQQDHAADHHQAVAQEQRQ